MHSGNYRIKSQELDNHRSFKDKNDEVDSTAKRDEIKHSNYFESDRLGPYIWPLSVGITIQFKSFKID